MTSIDNRFAAPTGYARDLIDAARDNPVSTALIGMGLAWMVMGGDTSSALRTVRDLGSSAAAKLDAGRQSVVDGASLLAASVSDTTSAGLATAADQASEIKSSAKRQLDGASAGTSVGSGVMASVKGGLGSATQAVGDVASSTQATASKLGNQASDGAVDLIATLRSGFADLLDRQPLVLGALGFAVGAGVAAALPRIAAEGSLTDAAGSLKASVREGFVGAYARATDEARAQGLTLDAASDVVSDIGAKVSGVAKGAVSDAAPASRS